MERRRQREMGIRVPSSAEGILPALERAHAVWALREIAAALPRDAVVILNVSGRGDKDMEEVRRIRSQEGRA
ncbi:MAG: hypothetical protein D6729_12750 [Deltaproteobacteria bacterium]|nr:MAG: hypothetical protein D6729_12750 [Deltaproteobacteria bacterium]